MSDGSGIEQEIRDALDDAFPYDMDRMFPKRVGAGEYKRVRAKLELLLNLRPRLRAVLVDGEKVIYIAKGLVGNWWDLLCAGTYVSQSWIRTCVVLTDLRILIFNINRAGLQQDFRNQILCSEIKEVVPQSFLSGNPRLKLKDRVSFSMAGFRDLDRRQMEIYVPDLVAGTPEDVPRVAKSIEYMCPHCPATYTEHQTACASCGTAFKSPRKAAVMSLLLPGLGNFYLGHGAYGVYEMIGSLIEWAILVVMIVGAVMRADGRLSFLIIWIVIIVLTNTTAFFLTRAMARKGLIAATRPQRL